MCDPSTDLAGVAAILGGSALLAARGCARQAIDLPMLYPAEPGRTGTVLRSEDYNRPSFQGNWVFIKRLTEGANRDQSILFPERLDDFIAEADPLRVIDEKLLL